MAGSSWYSCCVCGGSTTKGCVLVPVAIDRQRMVCVSCANFCARHVSEIGDGCDDWFKVETTYQQRVREYAATCAQLEALARQDAAYHRAIAAMALHSARGTFTATASAAVVGMNSLASDVKRDTPSDPTEPEPAVHVPKPVPPGPLSGAELHEVAVHAADSMDVPRYVGRYFEARRQVGRLLDAPLA
jgi:hypothetical protein